MVTGYYYNFIETTFKYYTKLPPPILEWWLETWEELRKPKTFKISFIIGGDKQKEGENG